MNTLKFNQPELTTNIFVVFGVDGNEVIRFEKNGNIFVKGKLAENDKEVVDGFRRFLNSQGLMQSSS